MNVELGVYYRDAMFLWVSLFQDELEALLKENEELKSRSASLESQLKASLKPATTPISPGDTPHDSALLEEMANKLRAATELYQRVQEDADKLRDVRFPSSLPPYVSSFFLLSHFFPF